MSNKRGRAPTQSAMDFPDDFMSEEMVDGGEAPAPGMTPEQARERGYRLVIMGGRLCSHCEHCSDSGLCGVLNMDVSLAQAAECDAVEWAKRKQAA